MTTQAGIWIDKEHAVLVKISEAAEEIVRFHLDGHEADSQGAGSGSQGTHRPYEYMPEGRIERKKFADRKRMYVSLEEALDGTDSLLLIGPGEAKSEFAKHIALRRIPLTQFNVEVSDKMTEPQFAARVREHFADLKHN
jgi:hypothetical protein